MFDIGGKSTKGERELQEDCYLAFHMEEKRQTLGRTLQADVDFAVVCDGLGGEGNGAFCAHRVVQAFADSFALTSELGNLWKQRLMMALYSGNAALFDAKCRFSHELSPTSGAVLVAAAVDNGHLHFIAAGDAFVWLLRREGERYTCKRLNKLHVQWAKYEQGAPTGEYITQEEADKIRAARQPNIELRSQPNSCVLGGFIPCVDYSDDEPVMLRPGDFVVLATDGVEKAVGYSELCRMAEDRGTPVHRAQYLADDIIEAVNMAPRNGDFRKDNAACVVFKCD